MNLFTREETPFITEVAQYAGKHRGMTDSLECWEIEDPNATPFKDILETVCLEVSRCRSIPRSALILIDIFLRGKSLETSTVYVMLSGTTARNRKAAVKHLKRSSLLRQYAGLKVDHWDWPPQAPNIIMTGDRDVVFDKELLYDCPEFEIRRIVRDSKGDTISSTKYALFSIVATNFSPGPPQSGTLSCFILVGEEPFLLTPAHIFTPVPFEDAEETDGSVDSGSDSGSDLLRAGSATPPDDVSDSEATLSQDNRRGNSSKWTPPRQNLEYSPKFDSAARESEGFLMFSLDLDYALIRVPKSETFYRELRCVSEEMVEQISTGQLAVSMVSQSRGVLHGFLDSRPVHMRLPYSNNFSKFFPVSLRHAVSNGDCGSLVIDQTTDKIYGFVVAASVEGKIAYIMPADRILPDIMKRLDGKVGVDIMAKLSIRPRPILPPQPVLPVNEIDGIGAVEFSKHKAPPRSIIYPILSSWMENLASKGKKPASSNTLAGISLGTLEDHDLEKIELTSLIRGSTRKWAARDEIHTYLSKSSTLALFWSRSSIQVWQLGTSPATKIEEISKPRPITLAVVAEAHVAFVVQAGSLRQTLVIQNIGDASSTAVEYRFFAFPRCTTMTIDRNETYVALGFEKSVVRIFEITNTQRPFRLPSSNSAHPDKVETLSFSQDGKELIASTRNSKSGLIQFYLWRAPSFTFEDLKSHRYPGPMYESEDEGLSAAIIQPGNSSRNSVICVTTWTQSGTPVLIQTRGRRTIPIRSEGTGRQGKLGNRIQCAAFSRSGETLAMVNDKGHLYQVDRLSDPVVRRRATSKELTKRSTSFSMEFMVIADEELMVLAWADPANGSAHIKRVPLLSRPGLSSNETISSDAGED